MKTRGWSFPQAPTPSRFCPHLSTSVLRERTTNLPVHLPCIHASLRQPPLWFASHWREATWVVSHFPRISRNKEKVYFIFPLILRNKGGYLSKFRRVF